MKKYLMLALCAVLSVGLITGCGSKKEEKKEEEKKDNTVEISYTHGKGTFTVTVPKDEDGNAKYEFTTEKPKEISSSASFYLVTDTAVFGFSTGGMSYNTSKDYKAKYGETKATFDGYLEFIEDTDLYNKKSYLPGFEQLDLNGRKAIRYYNRTGGSGVYEYYGYFYLIGVDDIYTGSRVQMIVNYKKENRPSEIEEFDEETLAIINSLKITVNE